MGTEVIHGSILSFETVKTRLVCVCGGGHHGIRMGVTGHPVGGSPLLSSHVSQDQSGIRLAPPQQPQTHCLREAEMLF